jgi:hypothetical protein
MTGREPLPPINFAALANALLSRAAMLVPAWLPGGVQRGHEYVCASLAGGSGSSCSTNLANGKWADFASDAKGNDLVSLYAAINELPMGKAAVQLAREEGLEDVAGVQVAGAGSASEPRAPKPVRPATPAAAAPRIDEGWQTVTPVPDMAPAPTFKHQHRTPDDIDHKAEYWIDGALFGYVVRFRTSDGGKDTLPYTWCLSARDGAARWHWKTWDEPRPLYFPGGASPKAIDGPTGSLKPTVILVEGEKKAGLLQNLLEHVAPGVYVVASWPGGCKVWKKASWAWLSGCTVLLWPDCDGKREALTKSERDSCLDVAALDMAKAMKPVLPPDKQPGMAAMLGIGAMLRDAHACTVQLLPIPEPLAVPDGWDCADAITTDGWDGERVLAFFAHAYALPPGAGVDAPGTHPGAAVGKKIEGLANAHAPDGGDDDRDGCQTISGKKIPHWLGHYYDADKARWFVSRKLVIAALEHDPALCNVLGLNELSNNIEARLDWPWPNGKAGPVSGSADLMLGDYLTRTYGLPSIARAALVEAIETVAHARPFHPVRDYLLGLKHDRVRRIDKWLIYALGETPETLAEQHKGNGKAVCEYLALAGRYWLLGMVNRVMNPGCKFDYCPVLEGAGGLGKSTLVEVLASSPLFSDTHFDVGRGKDGQEQVQGLWIYEIAELANFGKAEIGLIKAFISGKVDRYRPSYGRTVESYARQCLLVGTTNEATYLRDRTGNRRFWPIPVRHRIRINWMRKQRDQLLAEAYALYLQGVPYTPGHEDELRLFVPMQESRLVETAVLSEMTHILTREPTGSGIQSIVNGLTQFVTISQLALALGVDAAKSNAALEGQIRSWLDHEGWQRVKKQINGARAWGYMRPDNWPPIEVPEAPAGAAGSTEGDDDAPF